MKNKKIQAKKLQLVNKKMTFEDIMKKYPDAIEVLFLNGMHCIGCAIAPNETIEDGARAHGIDPDNLINQINKKLSEKK